MCISAHICGISHLSNDLCLRHLVDLTFHSLFHSVGVCVGKFHQGKGFPIQIRSNNTYQKRQKGAPNVKEMNLQVEIEVQHDNCNNMPLIAVIWTNKAQVYTKRPGFTLKNICVKYTHHPRQRRQFDEGIFDVCK